MDDPYFELNSDFLWKADNLIFITLFLISIFIGEVISASEDNVTENFETEESHDVWSQAESGRVQCCFKPSRCVILWFFFYSLSKIAK